MFRFWALVALLLGSTECRDFFVSSSQTASLVRSEEYIVKMLNEYIGSLESRMNLLKEKVSKYSNELKDLQQSEKSSEKSPLHAYLLMKRTTVDLEEIINLLIDPLLEGVYSNLTAMQENESLPAADDLHGAASALIRLQFTYALNATSMSRGRLESPIMPTITTPAHLSARDCFFLGQHSMNENLFEQSVDWFATAMEKADADWYPSASTVEVLPYLEQAIQTLENFETSGPPLYLSDRDAPSPRLYEDSLPWDVEQQQYRRLCRGEKLRPSAWDRDLTCSYSFGHSPYFLINPIRLETVSRDPYIVILHDVINDRQIDILKDVAKPKLARSSHYAANGSFERSLWRTSANAWLKDEDHPELGVLNRKLAMMTGLRINNSAYDAESYQVVNYGIGGHYVPHHDYLQIKTANGHEPIKLKRSDKFEDLSGDRLATFMFYLTDVEAGGATVFPTIGVSVFPEKGSAAFWWNLRSNGIGDHLTRHGACPVLYGTKWVANKWFRSHNQFLAQPCSTNPQAKIKTL